MATITFTYSDTYATDFRDALADYGGGYQATVTNADGTTSPNPQTKAQFAKEVARQVLLNIYKNWKANQAKVAETTAAQQAETNLSIT